MIGLKVLLHRAIRKSLCHVKNICSSLKGIFIFYAEIAMSFNCDVDYCMGLATFLDCENLLMIIGYDFALLPCNRAWGCASLDHPSNSLREHYSGLLLL